MQAAIANSLRDERTGAGHGLGKGSGVETRQVAPPIHLPGATNSPEKEREPMRATKGTAGQSRAPHAPLHMAAGLGIAGEYAWVDNSDFQPKRQASSERVAPTQARSASVGTRPQAKGAGNRSGIVSLPKIGVPIAPDPQAKGAGNR